eukprot:m.74905 g.74905  ORF g.74905 m.74905 type:complete len:57 (+) comp13956_c0_seq2:172-342(+)
MFFFPLDRNASVLVPVLVQQSTRFIDSDDFCAHEFYEEDGSTLQRVPSHQLRPEVN